MGLYAIGDLHFSTENPKPMNIFGDNWDNHEKKIVDNWSETVKDSADGYSYANIGWASFDAAVNYLRDWLENRVEWLKVKWSKEYYLGEKDYEYSSTQVNGNYKYDTDK